MWSLSLFILAISLSIEMKSEKKKKGTIPVCVSELVDCFLHCYIKMDCKKTGFFIMKIIKLRTDAFGHKSVRLGTITRKIINSNTNNNTITIKIPIKWNESPYVVWCIIYAAYSDDCMLRHGKYLSETTYECVDCLMSNCVCPFVSILWISISMKKWKKT